MMDRWPFHQKSTYNTRPAQDHTPSPGGLFGTPMGFGKMEMMKQPQKIRESLFRILTDEGIEIVQVSKDGLRQRAVVEFSFNLGIPPTILCGSFRDKVREVVSIAHEAGHIIAYREMNREEARTYLCTMFASHGIGLEKISPAGQEFILDVEANASATGIRILMETGVDKEDLKIVKELMSNWYASYEKLCQKEVVRKVRKKIIENENTTFLVSHPARQPSD